MSFGIDVSHHEGRIDWNQVKNDPNQVTFMIAKVTEGSEQGSNFVDPNFQYNINGANNVGILTGAYHFFRAISINDARQEAAFFIKNLQSVTLTAPVFVDVEVNDGNLDPNTLTDAVNAFLTELKNAGYSSTGVYSNLYFFKNSLNISRLQNTLLWVARYSTSGPGMDCDIWQYTDTGSIEGINGDVDLNISYVDLDTGNNNNGPSSAFIGVATIAGDNVNLRDQPSLSGNVIGKLNRNESYKVFYEQNGWLNLGGNEFVYYDPSYICYCNYIGVATITGDNVNLRDQPSLNGNVIRTLYQNEAYKVYYEQNGWLNLGGNQFIYYDPSYIDYQLLSSCSDC